MEDLYEIKKIIHDLLIDRMGEVNDADLFLTRKRALAAGLDNQQFGLLMQEVHNSINWTKLRDEREGKDRVVGRPINLFGQEVKSLSKLGEVLFNNHTKALRYLEDHIFLKENINYLSNQNVDLTMSFLETYNAEPDAEKRFLKIIYQLNKGLPFKVEGELFTKLSDLLEKGWQDYDFFESIYKRFATGYLQLWIKQCFPELVGILPKEKSFKDFLYFIYSFNPEYPFYIGQELFHTPEDIAEAAKKESRLWLVLIKSIQDEQILTWLERTGRGAIITAYIEQTKFLIDHEKNQNDLSRSLIQKLIEIIQPEVELPSLSVSVDQLNFLGIESKPLLQPITVSLSNAGFVKATVLLDQQIDGIVIEQGYVSFFDLEHAKDITLHLNIDPLKLIKNRLYNLNLNIKTNYQSLSIPISVKTVFPLKTFSFYLLKYSLFTSIFFGFIRILIVAANGDNNWLAPEIAWSHITAQVPTNHVAYIAIFILSAAIPILLWPKVKKIEKI
ncbi:hypothetical protein ACFSR6_20715 [Pedobacter vanadiisoli]|uniref:Uncharacterized protein n=1 Tax=Pedobacter vanadiisoli TaxID=1761975 RepID=A0ABW5MP46_9SPHI